MFKEVETKFKIVHYKVCLDDRKVVEQALETLKTQCIDGKQIKFSLRNFNCEHFANYCKTGQAVSLQADKLPFIHSFITFLERIEENSRSLPFLHSSCHCLLWFQILIFNTKL